MRKVSRLWFWLLAAAALSAPAAVAADTLILRPNVRFEFTCSSSGSAAQLVKRGPYLFRAFDESVFVCYAATCASGGERFDPGAQLVLELEDDKQVSCRSNSSIGRLIFTAVN